jgi:hypothetical protein
MTGWEYMTKDAAVVPFSPGTVVYRDGMLSTMYYKMKEAGLIEKTFCGDRIDHDHFIRMFDESKKILQILCEVENNGTPTENITPVGFAWVEAPKGVDGARAAMCGFAFFRRTRYLRDLGMLGINYWMRALKITVIHGVLLQSNRPAIRYAHKLGFTTYATAPLFHFYKDDLVPAEAVVLESKDFLPAYDKWFESKNVMETVA